ncbi:hypothetical protein D3P96_06505 [Weissella viridescens]|uniref:Methylenetetrahydrofolate reductase n=1 Tax=Weissella viridescens TaxID=1629 RepID=A0A3P2R9V8_WEIVI|nr:methylenetetrahydrofolate reductase [Weissella viridescens]RRG17599.1 hypothetical protein D3P96_06505 [Weissella viridescens]
MNYSLEISTPTTVAEQQNLIKQIQKLPADHIEFIAITLGAGGSLEEATPVLRFIQLLQAAVGIPIVPHITGSHQTLAQVETMLQQLVNMNITTVLAVRGDGYPNAFEHGDDLIRFIKATTDLEVFGAAYPEGHPDDANVNQTVQTVARKQLAGARALMTQVVMDNHQLYRFEQALEAAQVSMPLIIGVMPYLQRERVESMIRLTHVTPSPEVKTWLAAEARNDFRATGTALTHLQIEDLQQHGFSHIHIFCQNDIASVAEILDCQPGDILSFSPDETSEH